MTTIPQRLRSLANVLQECGLEMNASKLLEIAAELEAPASDDVQARGIQEWADSPACAGKLLVLHRDHIATVSALQARIKELEARQAAIFEAVDMLGSARSFFNGYILSSGCILNNMEGTVQKWIDGLSALYRLEDAASKDHK